MKGGSEGARGPSPRAEETRKGGGGGAVTVRDEILHEKKFKRTGGKLVSYKE